ncbi:MAG: DUF1015 domain-containing protein [Deltaproteobacteria bacterium]|nr:DUF1015 domain-containing protein [Deltaproteobacteria bacterium]
MLRINPFAALRPLPQFSAHVASVPFDVLSAAEARAIAASNELSFLRVTRAEIDLPPDTDPHSDSVYERALINFRELQKKGVFVQDDKPGIYIYRLRVVLLGREVEQTGVVCCCHIDDYNNGLIKKHEKTRQDKEEDRTRHIITINANAGPVFLLYKNQNQIEALVQAEIEKEPLYDFTAVDGVRHTIWRTEDPDLYVQAFARLDDAYIADGHHRSASAARAAAYFRENNANHTGAEQYNWFLTVLFPADQLSVLPYHRVVKDLNGTKPDQLLRKLKEIGTVEKAGKPEPDEAGSFGMYFENRWFRLTLPKESIINHHPVNSLDYVLLYDRILNPVLGIGEIRTDQRIDFVGGIRGTKELEKRVDSGECAVAFAMRAATINQLLSVADAGMIMPPKSTWFEPKLRSGLLIHTLD